MKKYYIFLVFSFLLIIPLSSKAFIERAKDSVVVKEDEIIAGDFIQFANVIDVKGNVDGDVVVLGSSITISGVVGGDVIGAGSDITITGDVFGDVRVAGGTVDISGTVEKNINVYAGNVNLSDTSEIQKNAYITGGVLQSNGTVLGDLIAKGGQIVLDGPVEGNVHATIEGEGKVILMPNALVTGTLTQVTRAKKQLELKEGAQVLGDTAFEQSQASKAPAVFKNVFTFGKVIYLFGMLVIGLLLVTLVPKMVTQMAAEMKIHPWANIFKGFAIFGLTPIIVLLLFMTIIGIPLALILIPFYFVALYLSKVIAGIALGMYIVKKLNHDKAVKSLFAPMVLGLVVLVIVTNITIFGWIVSLVAMFWALGALYEFKKDVWKQWR